MRKLLCAATALTGLAFAHPAEAVLQLAINLNGVVFTCADGAGCDTNPLAGQLGTGNITIGGVNFLGSSQTQLTGGVNELTTTSFQITNTNLSAVSYQFAVSGTDFVGPVTSIDQSGSGTFTNAIGSTTQLSYFASGANAQGASTPTDLPGTNLSTSGVITATTLSNSIAYNSVNAFSDANLYSMSMGAVGTLVAGGQFTGRSQSEIAVNDVVEPTSLALMGVGLLGLGMVTNRRRPRADIGGLAA